MKRIALTFAAMLVAATGAFAQSQGPGGYPDRPVTVVVPFGAGGATDLQVRIATIQSADPENVGQPMVIVNRPGAGGQIGWNWLAEDAPTDGYTIFSYNLPHILLQAAARDVSYGLDNIVPLMNWGYDPAVLVVPTDSPFQTAEDVIAFAQENPGNLTVSGGGLLGGHHLLSLQFQREAGAPIAFIPAQSGGVEALSMVMGGQVQAGFNNMADAFRNQDRVRILAVAADARQSEFIPDVPTFQEAGLDISDESANVRGLAVMAGVDPEIAEFLAERTFRMVDNDRIRGRMDQIGAPMLLLTAEDVAERMRRQAELLESFAEDLGG